MDSRRRTAVALAQFKKAIQEPSEYLKFVIKSDSETHIWYVMLSNFSGNDNEFEGGEYLVRVELPENFPFEPPHFYFLTNQGLYGLDAKVCIGIGEFHKDQYRAALGVSGFCNQLISGLIGWKEMGGGIRISTTTVAKKKAFAAASRGYNRTHHPEIVKMIEDSFAEYSSKWDLSKIPAPIKAKLGLID